MSRAPRHIGRLSLIVLTAAIAAGLVLVTEVGSAQAAPRATADNASAASSLDPNSPQGKAWNWILGQRGSGTTVTSTSTITTTRDYPNDWTAAVSGTFAPHGVSSPVTHSASIVVDAPAQVAGSYAGPVSGHITLAPAANRWIVQVYRDTASGRQQEPLQTLVAADGTFSLDLGSIAGPPAGTWALGLLDATNSYAPTGTAWPADTYSNWAVEAFVVTDTAYLVDQQPARADGTFSFPSSRPGTKVFQLVDTSTGAVLAEQAPDFGLVRSFATGTEVYTYDQALSVITADDLDVDAASLTAGLISLQNSDGSFRESADVRNPAGGVAVARTGICAVATYALLRHLQTLDPADPARDAVLGAAQSGLTWLLNQRRADGLLAAGTGDYRADGSLDPSASPQWVSTEHNLDAWQTFHLAATVLGASSYTTAAANLDSAIVRVLWNRTNRRFQQGLAPDGSADNTDPLDVNSWGTLFLLDAGHSSMATQATAHLKAFASTTTGAAGYRAYYPQPAFTNAPANVWAEGTAGVVVARTRAGGSQAGAADLAHLAALQHADGSFPYATRADAPTGMTTDSSVTATAWFLLASLGQTAPSIW